MAGILGALIVLALGPLWEIWQVNVAGVLINRAVAGPADASPQARKAALDQAMTMMESAAERAPNDAVSQIPIWRTYGAAASHDPSDHAYGLLLLAVDTGHADRVGELWLGEVATAVNKWDEAEAVYGRIDASNLLIDRAEAALNAGSKQLATNWYNLAYTSVDAAIRRDRGQALVLDPVDSPSSNLANVMSQVAERVTSLYRIGRGYLQVGEPVEAVKVLEQAQSEANIQSPGAVTEQSLGFALAQAFAELLPDPPTGTVAGSFSPWPADPLAIGAVDGKTRVRLIVDQAIVLDKTAAAQVQAGRILLQIGDTDDGLDHLNTAIRLDGRSADAYLTLGSQYQTMGLLDQACAIYAKGVDQLPGNAELAVAYAIATFKTASADEALPLLEHAAGMKTSDPYLFANLGDCYLDLGLTDKARGAYLEGLDRSPGAKPLVSRLASLPAAGAS